MKPLECLIRRYAPMFFVILFASFAIKAQTITTFVECVEHNPSTNILTAYFGYNNTGTTAVTVPYGGNNFFIPAPNFRGQPTNFLPGLNRFVYSSTLDLNGIDKELSWTVTRTSPATATNNINNYCSRPITYQGRMTDGSNASPTGQYDLQFELYDQSSSGTALATIALENVAVTGGVFTVPLNFLPDSFSKNNGRYLQIGVRAGTSTGAFITLNPRQELTAAPYAVASGTAVDAQKLGGLDAKVYVRQNVLGNVAVVRPPAASTGGDLSVDGNLNVSGTITGNFNLPNDSPNYIQNTTTQQVSSNFNISGNGTVGTDLSVAGNVNGGLRISGQGTGRAIIGNLFNSNNYTGLSLANSTTTYNLLSSPTDGTLYLNRPDTFSIQFRKENVTQMTLDTDGNLAITGTLASGCRSGFTAIANGGLCVSALQTATTFYDGTNGAVKTCTDMQARVGNSADVMLTFSQGGFNYFGGINQGWLADHGGDNVWGTWLATTPTPDFDGPSLNAYTGGAGGTAPSLPYRCVY